MKWIGAALGGLVEIAAKESKPRAPCSLCGFTFSHSADCPEHPRVKYGMFRLPPQPPKEETPRKKRLAKAKGKPRKRRRKET